MIRRVIQIDEEKCNGCGACAKACHEGAIGMVDGKAKLMRDDYCDGLGDCLPACPTNAISFVEGSGRKQKTPWQACFPWLSRLNDENLCQKAGSGRYPVSKNSVTAYAVACANKACACERTIL